MTKKISDSEDYYLARVETSIAGIRLGKALGINKSHYASEAEAFVDAQKIQDRLEIEFPRPSTRIPRLPFYTTPQTTSKWGWSGISKTTKKGRDGNWEEDVFLVSYKNEEGTRTNQSFYPHLYRTEEEALRAAIVFRIEYELELLSQYEEEIRKWFSSVDSEPWPEIIGLINKFRNIRQEVLNSGGKPLPTNDAPVRRYRKPPTDIYQPRTTRLSPVAKAGRLTEEELGFLPDEDFTL